MGFLSSLVMGFVFGLGSIAGLNSLQKKRAKERREKALDIVLLARATQDDLRRIIDKDLYPNWVQFPEFERVNWLNKELKEIWPYVNKAASAVIRQAVEPKLEKYRPTMFQSLKFTKLTLGTIAPQLGGVKVVESSESELVLEVEFKWGGNPSIILAVNTYLGAALPVQVKDVQLFGVFRIQFKPLVDDFPCFGAITVAFREKPTIDFRLKVVGGEITAIPGLASTIDGMIRTAIMDTMVWPSRIVIPIRPGDYSDLQLHPVGQLDVLLVEAQGLVDKEVLGKSDPFAILYVRPIPSRMCKSKTINNNLNPFWGESFELVVEDVATQKLVVMVMDEEFSQPQLLGCVDVALERLQPGVLQDGWWDLVESLENPSANARPCGKVHLQLLYRALDKEGRLMVGPTFASSSSSSATHGPTMLERELGLADSLSAEPRLAGTAAGGRPSQRVVVRGVLFVTLHNGENLVAKDMTGLSDPYGVLYMHRTPDVKKKSKVQKQTLSPVWDQEFEFLVENALQDVLMLEVWDYDTFGKAFMGRAKILLRRVLYEGDHEDWFDLSEVNKGRVRLGLRWKAQPF